MNRFVVWIVGAGCACALVAGGCGSGQADRPPVRPDPADRGGAAPAGSAQAGVPGEYPPVGDRLTLSNDEWRRRLTPEQYEVLREQGTERPFSGAHWNEHRDGIYVCAACGAPLFRSQDKFESGTGWPSFTRTYEDGRVAVATDTSAGMTRDELHCARCGGHLGHVFDDGPPPTGKRYCIDSVSLDFRPAATAH